LKILIVEDEGMLAVTLKRLLRSNDLTDVEKAGTVEEARRILTETPIDFVMTDFNLPDGNGAQVIRFAKERISDIKTLCMSGREENESAALEAGASAFLAKPFTSDEFFGALARIGVI